MAEAQRPTTAGDMAHTWCNAGFCLTLEGKAVVGYKDGGFDLIPSTAPSGQGDILTELGYYGQAAIDEAEAEKQESAERREMLLRRWTAIFEINALPNARTIFEQSHPRFKSNLFMPTSSSSASLRRFDAVVAASQHERWLTTGHLNNCDYGIARVYPLDREIA